MTLRKAIRTGLIHEDLLTRWAESTHVSRAEVERSDRLHQWKKWLIAINMSTLILLGLVVMLLYPERVKASGSTIFFYFVPFLVVCVIIDYWPKPTLCQYFFNDIQTLRSMLCFKNDDPLNPGVLESRAAVRLRELGASIVHHRTVVEDSWVGLQSVGKRHSEEMLALCREEFYQLYELTHRFCVLLPEGSYLVATRSTFPT